VDIVEQVPNLLRRSGELNGLSRFFSPYKGESCRLAHGVAYHRAISVREPGPTDDISDTD
jgi:hypothetical protein